MNDQLQARQRFGAIRPVHPEMVTDAPAAVLLAGAKALEFHMIRAGYVLDVATVVETNRWPMEWQDDDLGGRWVTRRTPLAEGEQPTMWSIRFEAFGEPLTPPPMHPTGRDLDRLAEVLGDRPLYPLDTNDQT
jgi:hypothetical protein